ncbi:DUF3168 domain-containing protein [Novosphingobium sp. KN65.2]|uniref:tail completion protein gp17 n=1 Tax=Novosphingobium sp. KN65.2 TaxID=1478134 RepID=UPI0005E7D9CB|nr:DUF3168 domain-containing protein [Novosphingobium sp. KN65.2]CDO37146.1 conserved hypothetical protein [Novosphingobium sp. KN65.2]
MNGVVAIRQLLIADAALTALVPATRIQGGVLPQGTALPSVSITTVSGVDRNIPSPGATRHVTDRIQATVLAANYPSLLAVMDAVKKASADKFPTVSGISNVVVHTDGEGPDFMDETASIYLRTQDFRVSYTETR